MDTPHNSRFVLAKNNTYKCPDNNDWFLAFYVRNKWFDGNFYAFHGDYKEVKVIKWRELGEKQEEYQESNT